MDTNRIKYAGLIDGVHHYGFSAMASDCECQLVCEDAALANRVAQTVATEAWRIERRFSRYRPDSALSEINTNAGQVQALDAETTRLMDFANSAWQLSDGLFDISSGILRRHWDFGTDFAFPEARAIEQTLAFVGWQKIRWQAPELLLPTGMSLDLGGLAKEYAADRCCQLACSAPVGSVLVNLGGDIVVSPGQATTETPYRWRVGVEPLPGNSAETLKVYQLDHGAIATSGNTRRHIDHQGRRYGHILNPKTGWPVEDAPASVTVLAGTAIEAGFLATYASLLGAEGAKMLAETGYPFQFSV